MKKASDQPDSHRAFFLGWRPVGSVPIFSPPYTRHGVLDPKAASGEDGHFNIRALRPDYLKCLRRAEYLARYDGFYLLQMDLDAEQLDDIAPSGDEADDPLAAHRYATIRDIAGEVGMAVKTELKHPHYFHAPGWRPDGTPTAWRLIDNPLEIGLAGVCLFAVLRLTHGTNHFAPVVSTLAIVALALGLWTIALWALRGRFNSTERLNADTILFVRPTRLSLDLKTDIASLEKDFLSPNWLMDVQTRPPPTADHARRALGHLRRSLLAIAEDVDYWIVAAKSQDMTVTQPVLLVFWPAFIAAALTLGAGAIGWIPLAIALLTSGAFLLLCLFGFAISIIIFDLPRVKLLRATQGFFLAANPINEAIGRVVLQCEAKTDEAPVRGRIYAGAQEAHTANEAIGEIIVDTPTGNGPPVTLGASRVSDFRDVIEAYGVKTAGEAQRLQIKQFWAAMCAAVLGAIVTAFAIVTEINNGPFNPDQSSPVSGGS